MQWSHAIKTGKRKEFGCSCDTFPDGHARNRWLLGHLAEKGKGALA